MGVYYGITTLRLHISMCTFQEVLFKPPVYLLPARLTLPYDSVGSYFDHLSLEQRPQGSCGIWLMYYVGCLYMEISVKAMIQNY